MPDTSPLVFLKLVHRGFILLVELIFSALMHESAHALKCLMRRNNGSLAAQMLSTGMVEYLLDVLRGDLPGASLPCQIVIPM